MKTVTHIKTGNKYQTQGIVTNATNAQEGQVMVLYTNSDGVGFVRELQEFMEKFKADE